MILKPWAQVPVARHLLDENDDLDELETKKYGQIRPYAKVITKPNQQLQKQSGKTLIILSPRTGDYKKALITAYNGTCFPIGMLECGYIVFVEDTDKNNEENAAGGNEDDENENEHESLVPGRSSQSVSVEISQLKEDTMVVSVPFVEPFVCYEAAHQTLKSLTPSRVVLLSPVNTIPTSGPVYQLSNSQYSKLGKKSEIPLLEPPFMITGLGASFMSACDSLDIPCTAVTVKAEGPTGYEIIDHASTSAAVSQALTSILEPPHEIKLFESRPDGLYI